MTKVKIEVPKEFEIFLEKAVDIISNYNDKYDETGLIKIMDDMAKYRYYLKGRSDEAVRVSVIKGLSSDVLSELVDNLEALRNLDKQVNVIFNALVSEDNG